MARMHTPTAILDAKGSFKTNPRIKRPNEPKPNNAFRKTPPKGLDRYQQKAWNDIVKRVPAFVLTDADEIIVEIASCLLAEFRDSPTDMPFGKIGRLHALLGSMGLTPSDRAGMSIQKPKVNGFTELRA